jgi:hypothetical protein
VRVELWAVCYRCRSQRVNEVEWWRVGNDESRVIVMEQEAMVVRWTKTKNEGESQ